MVFALLSIALIFILNFNGIHIPTKNTHTYTYTPMKDTHTGTNTHLLIYFISGYLKLFFSRTLKILHKNVVLRLLSLMTRAGQLHLSVMC